MHSSEFPRVQLGHFPTPLEELKNLRAVLGGPTVWIKRDDCTGLSTGGNKTRKLEFLLADALRLGADTVITQGATQSNHARQTAAAAARLGLQAHLFLENRIGSEDPTYRANGNVLLGRLHGAELHMYEKGADLDAEIQTFCDDLRRGGRVPYVIPGGGSNAIGALGYVNAAEEILCQAGTLGLTIDLVVHACSSSGTQAGLVTGFAALKSNIPVLGIGVLAPQDEQEASVFDLVQRTAQLLRLQGAVKRSLVVANCDYLGERYGIPSPSTLEAIRLLARAEGILLDPVYTGKAMAGVIDLIGKGAFDRKSNIVFVHTGGSAGLFGYERTLAKDCGGER